MTQVKRTRRPNTIAATVSNGESAYAPESLDFDLAIAAFLRYCRVKNLTASTIEYYTNTLKRLAKLLPADKRPIDVDDGDIDDAILAQQETGDSETTTNMYLRGWRAFFNHVYDEGYITVNLAKRVRLIKAEKRVIETFSKEQLRKLFAVPNRSTFTGYRDYVLMLTLLETGARISEVEGIKITDINWGERMIKVFGKGRKERFVPFQHTLDKHLREYIAIRGALDHDFLFVNIDNNPMKKRSMQEIIGDYGKDANIKNVRVSPHTFRHTFARLYITNGGDIFSLQKILGHTSLDVVRLYVNLFSTDVAKAHSKYSPLDRLDEI